MACCVALAFVLAAMRTAWTWILGRPAAEEVFPPVARWRSGPDAGIPARNAASAPVAAPAALPLGRPLAATVLAYGLLVHLLVTTGVADIEPAGPAGWLVRDVVLAAVTIALLILGRGNVALAPALVGVGALWFALGVVDMHVVGGFEFNAVPLMLDLAFHLSGWWLMVTAAAVAVVQRRADVVPLGAAA